MRSRGYGLTDIGRRRVANEDAFALDNTLGVYVVADGMGGHAAGEIASEEAVAAVLGMVRREASFLAPFEERKPDDDEMRKMKRTVEAAVQAATYMIFALAENQPEQKGMGTTVSAMLIRGSIGIVGHVGDSRVYRVRDGVSERLTEDHTLVAWQVRQGILSEDEAERSPHRNVITRAVGSRDYVQVDTHIFDVEVGDRYMLCSDGLHGYVSDEEVAELCKLGIELAAKRFIDTANERGGKDNITAIVIEINE